MNPSGSSNVASTSEVYDIAEHMETDESFADQFSKQFPPTGTTATAPSHVNPAFGKVSELPSTKAMKTRVKNLVQKHSRLQERLLKYSGLLTVQDGQIVIASDEAAKAAKKLYQFRFVDLQSIRKDTLANVDRFIGPQAVQLLIDDVNADIDSMKTEIEAAPDTLRQELIGYTNAAMNSSLLTLEKDKKDYEQ